MNKFKGLIPYKKSILCIVIMAVLLLMNGYGHDKAHHNLKVSSVNHSGQQTYTPHFSYPKGEYRLSVNGSGTFYIYTADGNVLYQGTPDGIITLTLEKDESEIIFCSGETGTLSSFTIEKKGGLFLDDIVLTLSIVGMLSFVLYCTNKKGTITDDHITQILLLGIAVVATFPAFTETIIFGHDLNFHLYRIEGIKDGLLAGQFPVRIHPTHNNGYGYITQSVYPELFLYIPALLRILGVSAVSAYHIFLFCINIATAVIMYISAKGITNSAFSGKIAAVIYTFSTWRVINLYYRAALGEALAMIFFPLVFYGMYLILKGNHKKWWVLTLACTGVFMSHIISTVMVALIIITFVIIFWKDFISKERFFAFVKMGVTTVALNAWFLIGFIQYYLGLDLSIKHIPENTEYYQHALFPSQLFNLLGTKFGYSYLLDQGVMHDMSATLGVGVSVCLIFAVCYQFVNQDKRKEKKFGQTCLGLGIVLVCMTTTIFPWRMIQQSSLLNAFCGVVRLPSRLLSPASAAIVLVACIYLAEMIKDKKWQVTLLSFMALVSLFAFTVWGTAYTTQNAPVLKKGEAISTYGAVGFDKEYYIHGTSPDLLQANEYKTSSDVVLLDYKKDRTNIQLWLEGAGEHSWIEVPLLYYPGYTAKDNLGNALKVVDGNNHVLKIMLVEGSTTVDISYTGFWYFRVAEVMSLVTAGIFCLIVSKKVLIGLTYLRRGVY